MTVYEYRKRVREQLRADEGEKACVYQDHKGYWTIGIGRLVDPRVPGAGLRPREIEFLFENDLADREAELASRLPWFGRLDDARRGALVNMSFQLGVSGLMAFQKMLAAMRDERWADAEVHALDSKWAKVDTPPRARRIARQLATGEWQGGA